MNGRSQFHAICEAAANIIRRSHLIPAGVAVVAYERGEIESEIERSLGILGLCVVVLPFEPVHSINGSHPPFYDEADLIVHVLERPMINATVMGEDYRERESNLIGAGNSTNQKDSYRRTNDTDSNNKPY